MSADLVMYRAEITPTERGARVEVSAQSVEPGSPGWFGSADQAWADAVTRLHEMATELSLKASSIERMLGRRISR